MRKLLHNNILRRCNEEAYGCWQCDHFNYNGHLCKIFEKHVPNPKSLLPECMDARQKAKEFIQSMKGEV